MKNFFYTYIALSITSIPLYLFSADYVPLTEIPLAAPEGGTTFVVYVENMVLVLIGIAISLAVIYIVWGGVQYLSTDAWSGKTEGRKRIWAALSGLLLAIAAWIILNTINPNILNFELTNIDQSPEEPILTENLPAGTGAEGSGSGGYKKISKTRQYPGEATNTCEAVIGSDWHAATGCSEGDDSSVFWRSPDGITDPNDYICCQREQ